MEPSHVRNGFTYTLKNAYERDENPTILQSGQTNDGNLTLLELISLLLNKHTSNNLKFYKTAANIM